MIKVGNVLNFTRPILKTLRPNMSGYDSYLFIATKISFGTYIIIHVDDLFLTDMDCRAIISFLSAFENSLETRIGSKSAENLRVLQGKYKEKEEMYTNSQLVHD